MTPKPFPKYVRLAGATEMRFDEKEQWYWRHAGLWGIAAMWNGDDLIAVGSGVTTHLDGLKFEEITEAEWREANRNYL